MGWFFLSCVEAEGYWRLLSDFFVSCRLTAPFALLRDNPCVFCDLLLNKPTATWNLFVLYSKENVKADGEVPKEMTLEISDLV